MRRPWRRIARGEHDENVHRKDLLLTELVAIWAALDAYERLTAAPPPRP